MNALGFFVRRMAWQFGIKRERARWSAMTRETQLLAEAQDILGKNAWPAVEQIEDLSGEFWQLRDLDQQQGAMRETLDRLNTENEEAQEKLYKIEDSHEEQIEAIRRRKGSLMEQAVEVMRLVDEVKDQDADTRRRFTSLKAKLEVLKKQNGDYAAEIDRTRESLQKLKDAHTGYLSEIAERESEVQRVEAAVQRIDDDITSRRDKLKNDTAELVAEIGRRSKQIAELSAKIGAVENQKGEISFLVGQYLSNNLDSRDPAVQLALRPFRPLISRIKYLKASIQYNQRLARRNR